MIQEVASPGPDIAKSPEVDVGWNDTTLGQLARNLEDWAASDEVASEPHAAAPV